MKQDPFFLLSYFVFWGVDWSLGVDELELETSLLI